MIMSFAYTTPALLALQKTVTRRDWTSQHAAKFTPGMIVDAWNYSPRMVKCNPHKVAEIEIVSITPHPVAAMPDTDYKEEGFEFLDTAGIPCTLLPKWANCRTWRQYFDIWKTDLSTLYVVRFLPILILEGPNKGETGYRREEAV